MKIFVIGLTKCASTSFNAIFTLNKCKCQHADYWNNVKYDCFSDHVNSPKVFKTLDIEHPDSLFILNTRSLNSWLLSRLEHIQRHRRLLTYPSLETTIESWINWRNTFYSEILEYFLDRPHKLIIVDIEDPTWQTFFCTELKLKSYGRNLIANKHAKSIKYQEFIQLVNKVFVKMNIQGIEQTEKLTENKDKYLNVYKNNLNN